MLTPSAPVRANANSVCRTHSAEANDSSTAGTRPQEIVLTSSIRTWSPCACARAISAATLSARPRRGRRCQQMPDRRVSAGAGCHVTALERIAVKRDDPDPWLGGNEPADVPHPFPRACRGTGQRHTRERSGDPREIPQVLGDIPAWWASGHLPPVYVVPGEGAIELGLIADLERLHPMASDRRQQPRGLNTCRRATVGLEVDAERDPRSGRANQVPRDRPPVRH